MRRQAFPVPSTRTLQRLRLRAWDAVRGLRALSVGRLLVAATLGHLMLHCACLWSQEMGHVAPGMTRAETTVGP